MNDSAYGRCGSLWTADEPVAQRAYYALAEVQRALADTLAAFHADLWAASRSDVAVMCMTEFGRNAFENGGRGTDHGHGSLMLAMGGSVNGGRVLTEWPGLDEGQLYQEQDLQITIDYRDVITEVLTKRGGNTDPSGLFPEKGYTPTDHGVIASVGHASRQRVQVPHGSGSAASVGARSSVVTTAPSRR